ncbi:peptide chain release factor aRF-1 [Candidatus Bathyarchaeota archaeon]|nr:peptide chain release factor aRF-1 [Candidatus Bathyarchaeota archaeon]
MDRENSLLMYRLKRQLEELMTKEGRGTELVSLYIPPGRPISEVMNNLRQEYSTSANIKSDRTRKNVQAAIDRVMQRLKLFRETPPTGLAIFAGAIPQGEPGSERMETYVVIPPEPIGISYYGCDAHFFTAPLEELLKEKDTYGILLIDSSGATYATLKGRRLEVLHEITSGIPGKHRAGGQSARRFERLREMELNDFFHRAGRHANELFLSIKDLKGIVIGGPGPTKYDFAKGDYLNYVLKENIITILDTSYIGEQGLREVVAKAGEIIRGVRHLRERELVQYFLFQIGHDTGLATYGEGEVREQLEKGAVKTLLVSEALGLFRVFVRCSSCDYRETFTVTKRELQAFEMKIQSTQCPKCNASSLTIERSIDIIDELAELAEKTGAQVEVISKETEEGEMLLKSFGGIAALLRYV